MVGSRFLTDHLCEPAADAGGDGLFGGVRVRFHASRCSFNGVGGS